ncbi:metalloendopeptidase [Coemansia sp. RSA 353]|nr:metalloendopeptidase [Coemansia sp. RSA 637]KAJ2191222.1 metalloendopeptidase [Coemansia sp. RSA 532]KAJ2208341.1 metalloendopeptidase [Coemansia sp. RSA 521]KAJ2277742.1 metalloendopeptidase [Coemansia sp. RSA 371]KAJ2282208.1 metalloendopeptidase [Coemansia sp. RSA 370]KAJ2292450.1 metalloendopeptidase [Coemansia sp. RSA 355]KAJ2299484.1 metalloendopeptidase [Coemansia sp. RSA 353]KAJ2537203.1 metalloendopeptidase [Coemansia sp. RSA 1935]
MDGLCSEDKLLVERMVNGYCRSGLLLDEDKRNRLCDIESQLAKTVAEFTANISNDASKLLFTRNELSGLPATFFADKPLVTTNGIEKYVICVTKPNSMLVLRLATLEETRKAMYVALFTRCPNNIELLQQAVDLRQEKAKMLGFKSHASYTLDDLSMNNPDMVLDMLNTLRTQLTPMARRELAQLRAIKQADCESKGLEFTDFYDWDLAYYKRTKTECTHNIDSTLIKSYFHVPDVVCRLFALFEEIMQLRFCKVDASVWHPLVELYEVWDTNEFVGHCYLDLYSRPRKYANGATFHIRSGFTRKTGAREYPVVALVTNFVQPTNGEPALLSHANLKTLVHEMGHVLHNLCSVTKWSMFHGTRVCRDFVECPSQMLENIIWTPSVLQKLGVHYQTKQPIPLCIVDAIIAAKPQVAGVFYLQKLFYAVYDISIYHSPGSHVDASLVYNTLEKNVALCNTGGIETIGAATTRQVVRGYDSKCFVYLWGQALAADMFSTRFGRDGVFNQQTWMEYRNVILRPGGSTDIMNCVHQFLGRKPQYNAFFTQIGLD